MPELYYEKDGRKQDADLHEPILAAGDAVFKKSPAFQNTVLLAMGKLKLTAKEAKKLFG